RRPCNPLLTLRTGFRSVTRSGQPDGGASRREQRPIQRHNSACIRPCAHGVTACRPTSCACSHIWVLLRCFPWPALIFSNPPKGMVAIPPVHQGWIDIERPFAALVLSVPEAADVPASYTIRRHSRQRA